MIGVPILYLTSVSFLPQRVNAPSSVLLRLKLPCSLLSTMLLVKHCGVGMCLYAYSKDATVGCSLSLWLWVVFPDYVFIDIVFCDYEFEIVHANIASFKFVFKTLQSLKCIIIAGNCLPMWINKIPSALSIIRHNSYFDTRKGFLTFPDYSKPKF
jgi:hypothetical protein